MAAKKKTTEDTTPPVRSKATPVEAGDPVEYPSGLGSTFGERASANKKAVSGVKAENKAVTSTEGK